MEQYKDDYVLRQYVEKENMKALEDVMEVETVLSMPMDNLVFMKHYFKALGFDPESEDFITDVLKSKSTAKFDWLKPKPSKIEPIYKEPSFPKPYIGTGDKMPMRYTINYTESTSDAKTKK